MNSDNFYSLTSIETRSKILDSQSLRISSFEKKQNKIDDKLNKEQKKRDGVKSKKNPINKIEKIINKMDGFKNFSKTNNMMLNSGLSSLIGGGSGLSIAMTKLGIVPFKSLQRKINNFFSKERLKRRLKERCRDRKYISRLNKIIGFLSIRKIKDVFSEKKKQTTDIVMKIAKFFGGLAVAGYNLIKGVTKHLVKRFSIKSISMMSAVKFTDSSANLLGKLSKPLKSMFKYVGAVFSDKGLWKAIGWKNLLLIAGLGLLAGKVTDLLNFDKMKAHFNEGFSLKAMFKAAQEVDMRFYFAATGAAIGGMFGPLGALAGALVGFGGGWLLKKIAKRFGVDQEALEKELGNDILNDGIESVVDKQFDSRKHSNIDYKFDLYERSNANMSIYNNQSVDISKYTTGDASDANPIVKEFEGFRANPYYATADERSRGIVTQGYGMTNQVIPNINMSSPPISELDASKQINWYIDKYVKPNLPSDLNKEQSWAIESFGYNTGGPKKGSGLAKMLDNKEYDLVPNKLMEYTKANGTVLPGLVRRRKAEAALWEYGLKKQGNFSNSNNKHDNRSSIIQEEQDVSVIDFQSENSLTADMAYMR